MRAARTSIVVAVVVILLTALFFPSLSAVQGLSSQPEATQLETFVQVAIESRNYAITIVEAAQNQGLNVSHSETLLASGNSSLSIAQSDLATHSNLTPGLQLAQEAMNDFTNASIYASTSLLNSENSGYLEISASLGSIEAANNTANELNSVMISSCKVSPSNSSYELQFQQECSSAKSFVGFANVDLSQAYLLAVTLESGQAGVSLNQIESLIADAKGNISQAASVISQLSVFTYSQRARLYVTGPFAQMLEVANNTVAAQQELVSNFETALSGYQTFSSLQSAKVNSVEMQASLVSNDINMANGVMNDVSTQAQEEQATLSQLSTDMANFYAQIPSTLPASSITQLDSDISNVQAAISASSSSISALQAEASSFEQTTLNSMPDYLVAFQADDNSVESNNQALLSSYATLQADLSTITSLFPLAILLQWQTTLASIGQTLSSETVSLTSYLQNTVSDLTSAQSSSSSFATLVQTSASQIELGDGLLANFTDIYNSENLYLNSSSLAQLEISLASIQTTAQKSAEFVAASQSLLQATTTGLASSVQSLYSKGNSLASQTSASLAATINASSFLSSDLSIRSNSLSSARLEASQALNLFDGLQIPQGASLLSQAKIQVQIASKIA